MARVTPLERKGAAVCPASCGELVQGTWNGVNFLVPCPVDLYSLAVVKLRPSPGLTGPADRPKALEAVRRTLSFLGSPELGGELWLDSRIPRGKGMASSTADIGAAASAAAAALGMYLRPRDLAFLAVGIEPTDGTLLPGITLVDHVRGYWQLPLGQGPEAGILALDLGGQVDTLEFNAQPGLAEKNEANEALTRRAFLLVRRGIQEKNLGLLGQGTTLSAEANQSILFKPLLSELRDWSRRRGGAGIVAAHSGTVLGLLYQPERNLEKEEESLRRAFPAVGCSWHMRFIQGGVKVVNNNAAAWRELTVSQGKVRGLGVPGF